MSDHQIFRLSNGIRLVHRRIPASQIVHIGFFLNFGSRDETQANQGIAHFFEHMAFKGTRKRNSYHILTSLDAVGGELNAYTDKEKIVFFASARLPYAERCFDLLSDITFNSTFPPQHLERERNIILEELSMYEDNPDESLQDEFEKVLFGAHPLGMNILGTRKSLEGIRTRHFREFFLRHLDTEETVISVAGDMDIERVSRYAEKYVATIRRRRRELPRKKFTGYQPRMVTLSRPVKQARCAVGGLAFPWRDKRRTPFFLLVNLLGGPAMNSRLSMALREKHGYVYSIDAHYVPLTDAGLFAVFFGTEPSKLGKCLDLIHREFDKLTGSALTPRQLAQAREQVKGQLALSEENHQSIMMMMGRSLLDLGKVPTLEEVFDTLASVSGAHLQELAAKVFDRSRLSQLVMVPSTSATADDIY
jgi:predicted Zn-dependent peptidase